MLKEIPLRLLKRETWAGTREKEGEELDYYL